MRWVDFSKWQGDVSLASLQAMKNDGIEGVCVGSWHGIDANPYVEVVLARARSIGLKTATYFIINARRGASTVNLAKTACGAEWEHLSFAASDVEVTGVNETILQEALDETARLGQRPLIYTGGWFWNFWAVNLGRPPGFQRYPFWTSLYDGVASFNRNNVRGAEIWVAKQYTGSTRAYGTTVDFNIFSREWVNAWPAPPPAPEPPPAPAPEPPAPEPQEELTMAQYEELKALIQREAQLALERVNAAKKEAREFSQSRVHDPIVGRVGAVEQRVTALEARRPAPAPAPSQKTYKVVSGDTLGGIASKFTGDAGRWGEIPNIPANVRADPTKLQIGTVLSIPW